MSVKHARSTAGERRSGPIGYGVDVVRGALIGTAETVPGVSGGTIALMTGVYETVLTSAGHLLSGVRIAVSDIVRGRGVDRARPDLSRVAWKVLIPLAIGMVAALLVMSHFMEQWVDEYPVQMRALFFGLVLASLWVPASMAAQARSPRHDRDGWHLGDYGVALVSAVGAAIIVSLPPSHVEATPVVIVVAAAIAVSALVLPGLSGSFLLLTFGLYEPTLAAVNDRDLGYLGLFAVGALIGLASIVKLLQWLLENRRRVTLVVLTGIMAGSLRALWPWQDDDRGLLAPGDHLGISVVLFLVGFGVVAAGIVLERRITGEPIGEALDPTLEHAATHEHATGAESARVEGGPGSGGVAQGPGEAGRRPGDENL
ncbi:putative membrane protein [Sediminihabitans luteus]|uniref:Putative membrane protein n=1 Tax=Sediminihabitans luteus TaxID=1138585 RepID=A0A2M9CPC8_9CELL|nr:DUF368 domain-containing protein [Sediminihabitans luteus]PJJ73744.1 putative membrane protein [Sediminihabitans luteus]GIJ00513.1 hypothetical protein Slu03_28900 [Sediminihabitans luteus]